MQFIKSALLLGVLASQAMAIPARSQPRAGTSTRTLAVFPNSTPTPTPAPSTGPASGGNSTGSGGGDLGVPTGANFFQGQNGVSFGWVPDDANQGTITAINQKLGRQGGAYGWYSQIKSSSSYDDSQLTSVKDLKSSGAVFIPAVMPTGVKFADISDALAQSIASAMKTFTDQGIEVWLRFAHEMNYYVTDGTYPGGSQSDFIAAWKRVHSACAPNPKVKMYWSPNQASSTSLKSWFPGPQYVDIVGLDAYPASGSTFASVYADFYNAFAKPYNLPFVIGETGSGSYDTSSKEGWLKELTHADLGQFPLYKSASWFEYEKSGDFQVVVGESHETVQQTRSNFK